MSIKFRVLGGGGYFGFFLGGECRFYFYGREDLWEVYRDFKCIEVSGQYDSSDFLGSSWGGPSENNLQRFKHSSAKTS